MGAKAKKLGERGPARKELGELADEARGAAERAGEAIEEMLKVVALSNQRIDLIEAQAKGKKSPA